MIQNEDGSWDVEAVQGGVYDQASWEELRIAGVDEEVTRRAQHKFGATEDGTRTNIPLGHGRTSNVADRI